MELVEQRSYSTEAFAQLGRRSSGPSIKLLVTRKLLFLAPGRFSNLSKTEGYRPSRQKTTHRTTQDNTKRDERDEPQHDQHQRNPTHLPPPRTPRTNPLPPPPTRPAPSPAYLASLPPNNKLLPQTTTRPLPLPRPPPPRLAYNLPEPFHRNDLRPPQTKKQQPAPPRLSRNLSHRLPSTVQPPAFARGCSTRQARAGSLAVGCLYFVSCWRRCRLSRSRRRKWSCNRRTTTTPPNPTNNKPSNSLPHRFLAQNVPLATAVHGVALGSALEALQAQGD